MARAADVIGYMRDVVQGIRESVRSSLASRDPASLPALTGADTDTLMRQLADTEARMESAVALAELAATYAALTILTAIEEGTVMGEKDGRIEYRDDSKRVDMCGARDEFVERTYRP